MNIKVCYKKTIQIRPYEPATLEVEIDGIEVEGGLEAVPDIIGRAHSQLQDTVDFLLESQFKVPEDKKDNYSDDLLGAAEIQ